MSKSERPAQADSKKAADVMRDAIDKAIAQKKHEPIGNEEAERKVADDLKNAAEKDVDKAK